MNQPTPVSKPIHGPLTMRMSKASIHWRSWPWICAGRGIIATDEVWRQLDPALWEFTQNPWVVLQTVSKDKLKQRAGRSGLPQEH
jgi:starch phosphorylase